MKAVWSFRAVLAAALLWGTASACDSGRIGAPLDRRPLAAPKHFQVSEPHANARSVLSTCTRREAQFGSGIFGASGGTLVVGNNRLIIPPGALTRPTLITGTVPEDTIAQIRFEPHGLQFRKPAGLLLDVTGCTIDTPVPDVVYLDEEGRIVERIEALFTNFWHTVAAPLDHFSAYAVAV